MKNYLKAAFVALMMSATGWALANNLQNQNEETCINANRIRSEFQSILEYPHEILDGKSATVWIQFSVDETNHLKIEQVSTHDVALKAYVFGQLNGKKVNMSKNACDAGMIKINFSRHDPIYFVEF